MVINDELVQCVYCHEFLPRIEMYSVFRTGFGHKNGVDVPLGVCVPCEQKNERSSETKQADHARIGALELDD